MFEKINILNSYFYKCDNKLIKDEINWAYITAKNKFNFTKDFWPRGCLTRFFDFFFGDLAKNIVKVFLLSQNPNLKIIEYDQVRIDNFEKPDEYDLKIGDFEIEVKSSLEKYTDKLETMLNERRIIIGLYKPNEPIPDYRVQVFFIPMKLDNYWDFMQKNKCRCMKYSVHEDFILKKIPAMLDEIDIFIAGWIKKDDESRMLALKNRGILRMKNFKLGKSHREYLNFFIKDTRKLDDLVNEF